MAAANSLIVDDLDITNKYTCGICQCVLAEACRPDICQHTFCKVCLYNWYNKKQVCPMCIKPFNFNAIVMDDNLQDQINNLMTYCESCDQLQKLCELKSHMARCGNPTNTKGAQKNAGAVGYTKPSGGAGGQTPTNRYTFKCPYCDEKNLTVDDLRDHCNKNHSNGDMNVVCPVCKAMPWGDANLKSKNFLSHLNLRHKFEYDRFVDFNMNDEESVSKAIDISIQQVH